MPQRPGGPGPPVPTLNLASVRKGAVGPQRHRETPTQPGAGGPRTPSASGRDALLTLEGSRARGFPRGAASPPRGRLRAAVPGRTQSPRSGRGARPHSPAPEEDVVGPGHGEGDELLQRPAAAPALGVGSVLRVSGGSAAGGRQVPGVAEQKLPAVAPVFVSLAVAAQRLHPGGHSRVLAQVLRHLLRHVGPAGSRRPRADAAPGTRRVRRASGPVTAACTGGPLENAPLEAQTPNNSARSSRTAHFRPPPAPSLL